MNVIASTRGETLETEVKCLRDEVTILTMAIEGAIMRGQKSLDLLGDIPESDIVLEEDFAMTCAGTGSGVVGWVDDF